MIELKCSSLLGSSGTSGRLKRSDWRPAYSPINGNAALGGDGWRADLLIC
jgi:hypothetical protein